MKKTFESWKIWTILSALLFFMTCGVFIVHAAGSGNNWLFTQKYNTVPLNNTLTATGWNQLMGDLDNLIPNLIPDGAVMAFLTDSCPDGWTPFTAANGRFLMWASSKIGSWWWRNNITLTINELPKHSHGLQYWLFNGFAGWTAWNRPVIMNWDWKWPGLNNVDYDNGNNYGSTNKIWYKTEPIWGNSPIDIQNPYIKVRYCIKWNTTVQGDSCDAGYSNTSTLSCLQWYEIGDTKPSSMGGFTCGKCIESQCPSGRHECNLSYTEMWNVGVPNNKYYAWQNTCVKDDECCFRNAEEYAENFWRLSISSTNYNFDYDYIESICR